MARGEVFTHDEIKIGFFLAFSLALFFGMLLLFGRFGEAWSGRAEVRVVFANVQSLRREAPVHRNGEEVGRVKKIRVFRLDEKNLELLPKPGPDDLKNLPLTSAERNSLRLLSSAAFDEACRNLLLDRNLIELTLEVRTAGGRSYGVADKVRLSSNLLGETVVDISSGPEAEPWTADRLLLGVAGDFYSNLAHSMSEVRTILSDLTHVADVEDQAAFKEALRRKDRVLEGVTATQALLKKRAATTSKKFEGVGQQAAGARNSFEKLGELLAADGGRVRANLEKVQAEMQAQFIGLNEMTTQAKEELALRIEPIEKAIGEMQKVGGPEIERTKTAVRRMTDRFDVVANRLDSIAVRCGRFVDQSRPDLAPVGVSFKRSFENFEFMGAWALRRKDLMLSRKYRGEHDYLSALETWAKTGQSARDLRFAELSVRALLTRAENWLLPPHAPDDAERKVVRARLDWLQKLQAEFKRIGGEFAEGRNRMADELYFPFGVPKDDEVALPTRFGENQELKQP